jgi:hypothetical protein
LASKPGALNPMDAVSYESPSGRVSDSEAAGVPLTELKRWKVTVDSACDDIKRTAPRERMSLRKTPALAAKRSFPTDWHSKPSV